MNVPENCYECSLTNACLGPHYGGDECKFREEIAKASMPAQVGSLTAHELYYSKG